MGFCLDESYHTFLLYDFEGIFNWREWFLFFMVNNDLIGYFSLITLKTIVLIE